MSTAQNLFQQAQLAEAAYADFSNPDVTFKQALIAEGFSDAQAADFVTHWRVVSQQPDTVNGFSATVFQNTDTGQYSLAIRGSTPGSLTSSFLMDFSADFNLIATDGVAVSQLVDLYNYWQSLTHTGAYQAAKLSYMTAASDALILLSAGGAVTWADAALQYLGINIPVDPVVSQR